MIVDFRRDIHLRGAVFEDVARILLRRRNENNFIFRVCNFDSLFEIVKKYRFNCSGIKDVFSFFSVNRCLCDLVEFVVDNVESRNVLKINFYEVKSRRQDAKRNYFESCLSNHNFMVDMKNRGFGVFVISLVLFDDWRFSFNVYDYGSVLFRVYDSQRNKTVLFQRPLKV
ncbi:MAG: hypothetical protein ACLFN8_01350 [Candidatus Woesearchaeota archaeon]